MFVEARKRLFTVDEFHRMGELGILDDEARLELLGGEIFEMPPVGPDHQGDVDVLNVRFIRVLGDRAIVRIQGPVVLDDYSEPLPDVAVLRPRADFYRSAHPRPPDIFFLVEVADTSLRRDRFDKLPRYAAAGVPEVWILDLRGGRLEVHTDPAGAHYATTRVYEPEESVAPSAFPDAVVRVRDLIG